MKQVYYTNSADETRELAAKIAAETPNGTVFALDGNLGAGKTKQIFYLILNGKTLKTLLLRSVSDINAICTL